MSSNDPSQPHEPDPEEGSPGSTRREFVRRAAIVGGTLAWAAPVIQTVGIKAAGALGSPPPTTGTTGPTTGSGSLTGTVIDATTTNPIAGALVEIQGDGSATTDASGNYSISGAPAGANTVTAAASGYATGNASVTIPSGGSATQNFALSPLGAIRAVLTWNNLNSDLDLHASGPDGSSGRFHVAFFSQNPVEHASLDVDDTTGEGPETVTITISSVEGDFVAGEYHIWVHNFAGSPDFVTSEAVVTFFDRTSQAGQFSAADATVDPSEDLWHVLNFTINDAGDVTSTTVVQTFVTGDASTVL